MKLLLALLILSYTSTVKAEEYDPSLNISIYDQGTTQIVVVVTETCQTTYAVATTDMMNNTEAVVEDLIVRFKKDCGYNSR